MKRTDHGWTHPRNTFCRIQLSQRLRDSILMSQSSHLFKKFSKLACLFTLFSLKSYPETPKCKALTLSRMISCSKYEIVLRFSAKKRKLVKVRQ